MPQFPTGPDRRSIRLPYYNYQQAAWYFVTVCTYKHMLQFGNIQNSYMRLNVFGETVQTSWDSLPQRFPSVHLDLFVIMPNHVHGILVLTDVSPTSHKLPDLSKVPGRFRGSMQPGSMPSHPTLGEVVRTFKAAATYQIRASGNSSFAWQSRYYEHIIRDIDDLERIRTYIYNNPANWPKDKLYQR